MGLTRTGLHESAGVWRGSRGLAQNTRTAETFKRYDAAMDMRTTRSRRGLPMLLGIVAAGVALAALYACNGGTMGSRRLVEVFDNGPVGGPRGPSEGYIWVGRNANPPPGKTWAPTDPDTLTPEQRKRIR